MSTSMTRRRSALFFATLAASACADDDPPEQAGDSAGDTVAASDDGATSSADSTSADPGDSGADTTGDAPTTGADPDLAMAAHEFLARWPGLWVGPVDSMTSAGDFPTMNMDVRPADGHTLFSRVDLDAGNSLRLAFVIEEQPGGPVLVLRNGGKFIGLQRDDRTALVEADLDAETWRFCSITGGCAYIDATMDFDGPDSVLMHVDVKDKFHFDWPATRAELRELDGPFPVDDEPQPGDADFPPMPDLHVTLSWSDPLEVATDAWVILSTTPCYPSIDCTPSRFIRGAAEVGATSVDVVIEQIHAATYQANAVLDRNANFAGTLFPDSGDLVSFPDRDVDVAPEGESETNLVLSVEL
ncbi:MAG TPA: hypothetical protein VFG69_12895 [Nannocystaceae bacterium]|nr:hypothetical protein [Nannocystaceae bacterium]